MLRLGRKSERTQKPNSSYLVVLNDGFHNTNQTAKRRLIHSLGRLIEHEAVAHITAMQALNHLIDLIERKMLYLGCDVVPHEELHHFPEAAW